MITRRAGAVLVHGVLLSVLGIGQAEAAPMPLPPDSTCETTAWVLREAAHRQAWADLWVSVANCLNNTDENLFECLPEVWNEFQEAIALAEEQHEARLEVCEDLEDDGPYDPHLDPSEFSADVTNKYFPLIPGRTLVYEAQTEDGLERIEVTTLDETVVIAGIECRSVRDVVWLEGELIEDTTDWYAQHDNGDVWYMGEVARNYEDGFLDNLDGSWRTGKDSAKAGILMMGSPEEDAFYRQEYLVAEAEDVAEIESLDEDVKVPAGAFTGCLQTEDWTPLEPDSLEFKYYAPGVGMILEVNPDSGERLELIQIIN